jgi:hypothetical protein
MIRSANGAGCNEFNGDCFTGCVWMCGNEFLYLMGWGGLGIRQMRVEAGLGWVECEVLCETNRISANGNPTLCTSVIVPGSGYHVQSLSQVVQIHTTRE